MLTYKNKNHLIKILISIRQIKIVQIWLIKVDQLQVKTESKKWKTKIIKY